ncbi:hypothetical protein LTR09_007495 [Extremus antarcticus]|uniref:Uncharacterized protein n=1 Tax=Extremus antarcticus TaxID=702011 RepID=A0AAJ0DCW0_9PEZI|nr:hypothetical protein LTR09_007495 [Extremus antarcticus]
MALARARALRTLQSSLKRSFTTRTTPRVSAPARTTRTKQLSQRRYASGGEGGTHGAEEASDVPWAIGAVVVTVPACWYLWPTSGHAEHHGEQHEEHEEDGEEEGGEEKEGGEEEGKEDGGEDGGEEKDDSEQKEESSGGDDESKDEGKDDDSKDDSNAGQGENPQESSGNDKQKSDPSDASVRGSDSQKSDSSGAGEGSPGADEQSDDTPATEDQKTTPGGGGGRDDETEVKQVANERKLKKKPDSGQELGGTDQSFKDNPNQEGGPSHEVAATAKEAEKGKTGETTGKQFGISTGPTKHSLPIDSDTSKSKKGEGTPETAKAQGTVDSNRPAR